MKAIVHFLANSLGTMLGIAALYLIFITLNFFTGDLCSLMLFLIIPGLMNGVTLCLLDFFNTKKPSALDSICLSTIFLGMLLAIATCNYGGSSFVRWTLVEFYGICGGLGAVYLRKKWLPK